MYIGESVELGVHEVEHVNNIYGLTGGTDVCECDHITKQNSAHLKLPWKKQTFWQFQTDF